MNVFTFTAPVFDEEGRLIRGSILGNMFPRDIKDFVCNLQNEENKNKKLEKRPLIHTRFLIRFRNTKMGMFSK